MAERIAPRRRPLLGDILDLAEQVAASIRPAHTPYLGADWSGALSTVDRDEIMDRRRSIDRIRRDLQKPVFVGREALLATEALRALARLHQSLYVSEAQPIRTFHDECRQLLLLGLEPTLGHSRRLEEIALALKARADALPRLGDDRERSVDRIPVRELVQDIRTSTSRTPDGRQQRALRALSDRVEALERRIAAGAGSVDHRGASAPAISGADPAALEALLQWSCKSAVSALRHLRDEAAAPSSVTPIEMMRTCGCSDCTHDLAMSGLVNEPDEPAVTLHARAEPFFRGIGFVAPSQSVNHISVVVRPTDAVRPGPVRDVFMAHEGQAGHVRHFAAAMDGPTAPWRGLFNSAESKEGWAILAERSVSTRSRGHQREVLGQRARRLIHATIGLSRKLRGVDAAENATARLGSIFPDFFETSFAGAGRELGIHYVGGAMRAELALSHVGGNAGELAKCLRWGFVDLATATALQAAGNHKGE